MGWLSEGLKIATFGLYGANLLQSSEDRRSANQAAKEQIDFYQAQKALMTQGFAQNEQERKMNQEKINRKQIRSARIAYRSPGFMDEGSSGYNNTLG